MAKTEGETWQLREIGGVVGGALLIVLVHAYLRTKQIESVERYAFFCVAIGALQGFGAAMLARSREAQAAVYGSLVAFALGLVAVLAGMLGDTSFLNGVVVTVLMWLVTVPGSYVGAYLALHLKGKNNLENKEPEPAPQIDRSFKIR